jgi:SAM-dependent methyltransferase
MNEPMARAGDDLWEAHADWWIEGFTDGADPEYEEQILPMAAAELAGARRVLDVGCGDGQISRLAVALGAETVIGIDPTWNQLTVAKERDGGARYARSGAAAMPFPDGTFDAVVACLVFEHIRDVDDAIAEVARVLAAGGRFCFFLNHPLLQAPNSGWIDDQILAGGGERRVHPVHPPPAEPLRERARRQRPAHRADGRARTSSGVPGAGRGVRRRVDDPAPAVPAHPQALNAALAGIIRHIIPVADAALRIN